MTTPTTCNAIILDEVGNGALLDLKESESAKLFRNGQKALKGEKNDMQPKGLRKFVQKLRAKAIQYVWYDVFTVPTMGTNPINRNGSVPYSNFRRM
jgi:hypothetical protein